MKGAWFLVLGVSVWAQVPTAWTPEFSLQFKTIGTVIPSPDGARVAWTETQSVLESERSETLTHVFLAHADGSHRMQLTRGDKSCTAPVFSPDGRYVYFQSARSGKMNVYRIAVAGGEAEKLTDFKGDVAAFDLSPDGKTIAFAGHEPSPDEEKRKKEKRDWRVVDADPANHAIYLVPAEPGAEGKRPQRKLTDGQRHVEQFAWSPDSRFLAFSHVPTPGADDWTKADLSEVEVVSGTVRTIAATNAAETHPVYSRDGKYLAYSRSSDPPRWVADSRIVLLTRANHQSRTLPATEDAQPNLLGFTSDSARLLFLEARRTQTVVYAMPLDGPAQTLFSPAKGMVGSGAHLNATGTHLGVPMESSDEAPEAYLLRIGEGSPQRVSAANTSMPKLPLGKTEAIRWKSKDGWEIEGLLTYPVNYHAGRKYPLILNIHGGPAGVFNDSFIGRSGLYPLAVFASRGYAVLRPNPRGSSGYGIKFRFGNLGDWGGKDYEDDQSGVDHVISMGIADPERLAVMGWSYGGYMTSWTITQTHRFKAAAVGAGVTDLWSFTGTSDIMGFLPDYFGGEPWANFEAFRKHSPLTYVKNVTTPTLVLHGEADVRVPTSQGYEYYHALKRLGVTTQMVVYPRQPHGPNEPKFMLDIMQRHIDWVDKYVP